MTSPNVEDAVRKLYEVVRTLESRFPGRPFTPVGHMVGSLGECLVAEAYALRLLPPSNAGFDAIDAVGRKIEIKATQCNSVAFRSEPEHCIAIKPKKDGSFVEIFNGPGHLIWRTFENKPRPSNGQFQISLAKLRTLQMNVQQSEKIKRDT